MNTTTFACPSDKSCALLPRGRHRSLLCFPARVCLELCPTAILLSSGDASHPLCGNFGAGAGFALEDVFALIKALDWAWSRGGNLWPDALDLFDSSRSPHYTRIYADLDTFTAIKATLQAEALSVDEEIEERVKRISDASESWMYNYEIDKVVEKALRKADKRIQIAQTTSTLTDICSSRNPRKKSLVPWRLETANHLSETAPSVHHDPPKTDPSRSAKN